MGYSAAMALPSTICKAVLHVSDIDRNYYAEHALTIARHPSETDERMMVRLVAFALNAHEHLTFGKGVAASDEPDLWHKDLTGAIVHWIEVGQPDDKTLLRAAGRAERVTVYAYRSGAELWWAPIADRLARARQLAVWRIPTSGQPDAERPRRAQHAPAVHDPGRRRSGSAMRHQNRADRTGCAQGTRSVASPALSNSRP